MSRRLAVVLVGLHVAVARNNTQAPTETTAPSPSPSVFPTSQPPSSLPTFLLPTESPEPSPSPSFHPTSPFPSGTPTANPPTASPAPSPSPTTPSATDSPTMFGTSQAPSLSTQPSTGVPTADFPTESPEPSPSPSAERSNFPTESPEPSPSPTSRRAEGPSFSPSSKPSSQLSASPSMSSGPSRTQKTILPTIGRSSHPSFHPSSSPTTEQPTAGPTLSPSMQATPNPTPEPSPTPTQPPTPNLTPHPTPIPTTTVLTVEPTPEPASTPAPSLELPPVSVDITPIRAPVPTIFPDSPLPSPRPTTGTATIGPTMRPTTSPLLGTVPTLLPTPKVTTLVPTSMKNLSAEPSESPLVIPSLLPSHSPTISPSLTPTLNPSISSRPSDIPSQSSEPTNTPVPTATNNIQYFDMPEEKWSYQLSGQAGSGNSVTSSPDGALLYVTSQQGNLDVLQASDGSLRWSFQPERIRADSTVSCQSGVAFGELDGLGVFAVYAVVDRSIGGSAGTQSRLVGVSHPYNRLLWISKPFDGVVQGTPVVTQGGMYRGRFIFLTHNVVAADGVEEGFFSIFSTEANATQLFKEGSGILSIADRAPYSPLGVAPFPSFGNYPVGLQNTNDLVVWMTTLDKGTARSGYLRAFQIPRQFDTSADDLATFRLVDVPWSGIAKPALSSNGLDMFAAIRQSQLRGWVRDRSFTNNPNLQTQLDTNPSNPVDPIPSSPVLSHDETRLFSGSAATSISALDSQAGSMLWTTTTESQVIQEVKISPDDRWVYALETASGRVLALDQISGSPLFALNCSEVSANCTKPSEAEFTLSPSGAVLFFVDSNKTLFSWQLGVFQFPTPAPTDFPTTSSAPTVTPSVSDMPTPPAASQQPSVISIDMQSPTTTTTTMTPTTQAPFTLTTGDIANNISDGSVKKLLLTSFVSLVATSLFVLL